MIDKNTTQIETIPCKICLQEIPSSVNQNAEADEYVSNYCGLECYQQWRDKQLEETE
ncbi:MAG: DUF3330 domain-containing protein [Gammaproteobacteria bacterium]|nr:DUF3330 domain-containing protein [Gammaproteobacteria bacterium]